MVSSWWGSSALDEIIEKATSELLPAGQEDLALHLDISDQIRSKKVAPKDAMRALKRRLNHKNPNVQLSTLSLLDTCVKNSGDAFVKEIASREFMDDMVSIMRAPGCNLDVKNKILSVIQTWGIASKGKSTLSYMTDTYTLLKAEGYVFPPVKEHVDSILLETSAAPEWTDSDVCERCRTPFTVTNRKHHCRQCGGTFCQQCSSKNMRLPHLAINEEVRVCDGCYIKLKLARVAKKESLQAAYSSGSSPTPAPSQTIPSAAKKSTEPEDAFDDDLKKAIELSLKEEEQRKNRYGAGYAPPQSSVSQRPASPTPKAMEEEDPDLAAAIAASLRDMQISAPSAPSNYEQRSYVPPNDDLSMVETENIQLFSILMERLHASGGDVFRDPQINQLYEQIGALQPKLFKSLDDTNRKHRTFVELHEKLNLAVRTYDRLLEERVKGAYTKGGASYPYYSNGPSYGSMATPPTEPSPALYPNVQASNYYPMPNGPANMYPPSSVAEPAAPYYQAPMNDPYAANAYAPSGVPDANAGQVPPAPSTAQQPIYNVQPTSVPYDQYQQSPQHQPQQQQQQPVYGYASPHQTQMYPPQQQPQPQPQQQQQQQPPAQQYQPPKKVDEAPLIEL
ncbi:uncharacterized protein BYT42DRAFT_612540 [Radiomyces spectabilis]|uniref:uncharacterized protein n=1 Tax=Radiomyces spectabilis TaxID=64574 RepID=UPI002220B46A|nr:uncharacterized protein BYT42DRAFT_612540 [Radiomyces spectabilis]KAI8384873.1 hypothetical protein BYT42DRAFT_612540 [Radiomyces spectabilis]